MSGHAGVGIDHDEITAVVLPATGPARTATQPIDECTHESLDGSPYGLAAGVRRLLASLGWYEAPGRQLTVAVPLSWERRRIEQLRAALDRTGSAVPGSAVPGSAVPGSAVPGSAVPGSAVPGSAVPGLGGPGTTIVSRPTAALRTADRRRREQAVVVDIGRLGTEISTVGGGPAPRVSAEGPADLGAAELDWVVLGHVLDELTGTLAADVDRSALVVRCRAARVELSRAGAAVVEVPVGGGTERVRIARAEFEAAIRQPVSDLVARVSRALAEQRGGGGRLVLVAGDGADLPLLERAMTMGVAARRWTAPGPTAVATGAAYLSVDRARAVYRPAPAPRQPVPSGVRTAAAVAAATLAGAALAGP